MLFSVSSCDVAYLFSKTVFGLVNFTLERGLGVRE